MIPMYILGLLLRCGPLHGYQLKKLIGERLSDFTQIKLPTIYYHLEKMRGEGLLDAAAEKPGSRPEKTTYSVTEKGAAVFIDMLRTALDTDYRPVFPADGAFFFSDRLSNGEIREHLRSYTEKLESKLELIRQHREETLRFIPEQSRKNAEIIFRHHEHHYRAELQWAIETLSSYEEVE